jgi:predicted dehydrogenase
MTDTNHDDRELAAGVVGVGSMGRHHARVYDQLPGVRLAGVADADEESARDLAAEYRTTAMDTGALLDAVDAVSVAVPTEYHYSICRESIDRGVPTLVEKPFVEHLDQGRDLVARAERRGVPLQVGHIERFNPAVETLAEVVDDLDVVALAADRLGPPVDREITDDAVLDLMIHDIDVLLSVVDAPVESVSAAGAPDDPYVTATFTFENGVVATLTASRVTQQKVRELSISARDCRVVVDYLDQSVELHRDSMPEYVETGEGVRYRHSSVIERPTVDSGEPLYNELESFLQAIRTDSEPQVTGEDGLRAIELARAVVEAADRDEQDRPETTVPDGTATMGSPNDVSR